MSFNRLYAVLSAMFLLCSASGAAADATILSAVNALRADADRAALTYSTRLQRVAEIHARDMAARGFFSHRGSDGSTLSDRARRVGYGFCFIAENIAKGQRPQQAVMESWVNSRGHRRNMLDRRASEIGLARAEGALWVMVLGRPGC